MTFSENITSNFFRGTEIFWETGKITFPKKNDKKKSWFYKRIYAYANDNFFTTTISSLDINF